MARFMEIFRCSGVDDEAKPDAGMIVPSGSTNLVALLDGDGWRVAPVNKSIRVDEIADPSVLRTMRIALNIALSQPGVDPQFKSAFMPDTFFGNSRYFAIGGKTAVGQPGAVVQATSGRQVPVKLRVVVLDKKPIKLAIRNVQVPDAQGNPMFHSKKPCDPKKERDDMNAVWTPQTNLAFELVSSNPVLIDDRKKPLREQIARALGLKDTEASFPAENVDAQKLAGVFNQFKDDKADFTIFLVQSLAISLKRGFDQPSGWTSEKYGFAAIAGTHFPTTFAHEAGHYLGGEFGADGWENLHHTGEDDRLLMRDGGASWKIPFAIAMKFRGFLDRRKKGK